MRHPLNLKRITLDEYWKLCISMWTWIVKQRRAGRMDVESLKTQWLENHGYEYVYSGCFFCHWLELRSRKTETAATCGGRCPGQSVNVDFDCGDYTYAYNRWPVKFLAELRRLNRIRLGKKVK